MKELTFLDLVARHFDYPLHYYGFSVLYRSAESGFGPQVTTWGAGRCIVAFVLDKGGGVLIRVGSANKAHLSAYGLPEPYFDIGVIVAFLTPEMTSEELMRFYPPSDRSQPIDLAADQELAGLAQKLRPYWERVLALCESGDLDAHRAEFEQLSAKRHDAFMRDIFGRKDKDAADGKPG